MNADVSNSPLMSSKLRSDRPAVSVVIVAWNAKKYVMECLESLREHCREVCDEVIIVDNASTDGTPELIAEMFPEVKLIRNTENLGFARANNIGMSQSTGEIVCLVNSDVKFTNDCITPMLTYMEKNPGVGMLGPKMLGGDGTTAYRSTLRFPTVWNTFCRALGLDVAFKGSRLFGGLLMSDFDHNITMPVEVLVGWFWVVRREVLQRVGLMDTQFFMYGEDIDWCYRFHESGEGVVFFADAEAYHYGGASSSAAPARFYLEACRANWRYFRKHHGLLAQMAYLAAVSVHHTLRLAGFACVYLFVPSRRSRTKIGLTGSLKCLQWVSTAGFSH